MSKFWPMYRSGSGVYRFRVVLLKGNDMHFLSFILLPWMAAMGTWPWGTRAALLGHQMRLPVRMTEHQSQGDSSPCWIRKLLHRTPCPGFSIRKKSMSVFWNPCLGRISVKTVELIPSSRWCNGQWSYKTNFWHSHGRDKDEACEIKLKRTEKSMQIMNQGLMIQSDCRWEYRYLGWLGKA